MALEKALWQRVRKGGIALRTLGHLVHLYRVENDVGVGDPDVDGCINGTDIKIELKSCSRPARPTTPIRPKVRKEQEDWMVERHHAGSRSCFVLIQVGDNHDARLYLIPGVLYAQIVAPESELARMSVLDNNRANLMNVLLRATEGY
jgi:hypothetical protein